MRIAMVHVPPLVRQMFMSRCGRWLRCQVGRADPVAGERWIAAGVGDAAV